MEFCIQVSNPRLERKDLDIEVTLEDAIEEIYPLDSEKAIMVWNGLYIPLSYKYDISVIITDIINLLETLIGDDRGSYSVWWPSNTFSSEWELNWNCETLKIKAHWESVIGKIEDKLNSVPTIEINKNKFLFEWKKLLILLMEDLNKSGYNSSNIPEIAKLSSIEKKITNFGVLYF